MERVIRVMDRRAGEPRVFLDLHEVLPVFSPDGHVWRWAIRGQPELTAMPRWDLDLPYVFEQIEMSPRGFVLSFEELEQFAGRINQVIWGEFLAAEYEGQLPMKSVAPEEVGRSALAGALAFDSSYWFLGGPGHVIERAVRRFDRIEEVAPEEWPALD